MNKIIKQLKKDSLIRIIAGFFLVILGLLLHLIPFFPGSWIIFLGLEILGVRLLVWDEINAQLQKYSPKQANRIKLIIIIAVVSIILVVFGFSLALGNR